MRYGLLLWRGPRWAPAILLAVLGMVGPSSIDTYQQAFVGITDARGATPVQVQQTLPAYLFWFSFMTLFHGAISDSFCRRPVVLCGVARKLGNGPAIARLATHCTRAMALAMILLMAIALVGWIVLRRRWPLLGRLEDAAPASRPKVSAGR